MFSITQDPETMTISMHNSYNKLWKRDSTLMTIVFTTWRVFYRSHRQQGAAFLESTAPEAESEMAGHKSE